MLDHLASLEGIHKPDESINTFKVVQVSAKQKSEHFRKRGRWYWRFFIKYFKKLKVIENENCLNGGDNAT